jgi:hypothetical protein
MVFVQCVLNSLHTFLFIINNNINSIRLKVKIMKIVIIYHFPLFYCFFSHASCCYSSNYLHLKQRQPLFRHYSFDDRTTQYFNLQDLSRRQQHNFMVIVNMISKEINAL